MGPLWSDAGEILWSKFDEVMDMLADELRREGFPGVPLASLGATNDALLKAHWDFIKAVVKERLGKLAARDYTVEELAGGKSVEQGLCDAVKVFIKNEPHKLTKIRTGRLRLIWVMSMVDTLIDRLLWHKLTKSNIEHWQDTAAAPGMGATDEAFKVIWSDLERLCTKFGIDNSDVSGWDFSVKFWMQVCDYLGCLHTVRAPYGSTFQRVARNRLKITATPMLVLGDGRAFIFNRLAFQVTGRLRTSDGNTRMRLTLAALRGVACRAMGDDAVESALESSAESFYASLGFKVEGVRMAGPPGTVFCSYHHLSRGRAFNVNWGRMLFRFYTSLQRGKVEWEHYAQLADELRHMDEGLRSTILGHLQRDVAEGLHQEGVQIDDGSAGV